MVESVDFTKRESLQNGTLKREVVVGPQAVDDTLF